MLTKEDIKYISQNINPEEAQYVMGVSNILNDVGNEYKSRYNDDITINNEKPNIPQLGNILDDILIINQIIAYNAKMQSSPYVCKTDNYKYKVQDIQWQLKDAMDQCVKILMSKYGNDYTIIHNLEVATSCDPLVLLNDLKELIFIYLNKAAQAECAEDYVLKNILDELLKNICKSIYECRLAKAAEQNIDMFK